jgi:phosphogluconate dehydratase
VPRRGATTRPRRPEFDLAGLLGGIKVSAVDPNHRSIKAPARVFDSQYALQAAFDGEALSGDFVAVIRGQGPQANGMPELHRLTPLLSVLQDRGQRVALLTDGRMSGASGKVLAAIHVVPEAVAAGAIGRIRDGDHVHIDAEAGVLELDLPGDTLAARPAMPRPAANTFGTGRELFALLRRHAGTAEDGACALLDAMNLDDTRENT